MSKENNLIDDFINSLLNTDAHREASAVAGNNRKIRADKALNDFFSNMDEVNSPLDFEVKKNEIDTLNPYFPEYSNARGMMYNTINEREDAYKIYKEAVKSAQKLIKDNKIWLEGNPDRVYEEVKHWTVDDVWETATKIRKYRSSLEFGDPSNAEHGQGQNFTQGTPGNKAIVDEFKRLDEIWQMILYDAAESKKHTLQKHTNADGTTADSRFIPLLTKDDIRAILLGDKEAFEEKRQAATEKLVNSFDNNVKQMNRLDSFVNSFVKKSIVDGKEEKVFVAIDGGSFGVHNFRADINPMDKEVMDMAFSLTDANGNMSVDDGNSLVEFIERKINGLQDANDQLNLSSLKWANSPIVPLAEEMYKYKDIDDKGFLTYNLGLINDMGEPVADQVILTDRKTDLQKEEAREAGLMENLGK